MKKTGILASAIFLMGLPAMADMVVENCIIREAPPGTKMTAAYADLLFVNDEATQALRLPGAEELRLGFIPELSDRVETHQVKQVDGKMVMSQTGKVKLPNDKVKQLKPGDHHLMLMDLKKQPKAGETYEIEFWFSYTGEVTCLAEVKTSEEIMEIYK